MSFVVTLVKGFAGKPSHAPLTDASIGAYVIVSIPPKGRRRVS